MLPLFFIPGTAQTQPKRYACPFVACGRHVALSCATRAVYLPRQEFQSPWLDRLQALLSDDACSAHSFHLLVRLLQCCAWPANAAIRLPNGAIYELFSATGEHSCPSAPLTGGRGIFLKLFIGTRVLDESDRSRGLHLYFLLRRSGREGKRFPMLLIGVLALC